MKRHGFKGLGAGHGVQRKHRSPGSIGGCSTPGRVFKGMRMAGRMGNDKVTTQNLTVHAVDADKGLVLIHGAVPGPKGGVVLIRSAVKNHEQGWCLMTTVQITTPGRRGRRQRRAAGRHLRRHGQRAADAPGRGGPAGRRPAGHAQDQDPR